jgi:DNA polymerase I-like protein with 3'-5' exonuclease and polymerase domains
MTTWNISSPTTEYYDHTSPDLHKIIAEVKATPEIAIDTETTGLVTWKDMPLYWSLAWGSRRMTLNASALPYFREAFEMPDKRWIFANAKYDAHILANAGIRILGELADIQVMHALLYEERSHSLKDINEELFQWRWADFQDTFGKIGAKQSAADRIHKAEQENFGLLVEYAANDAWGTLKCYEELKKRLQEAYTYSLFRDDYPHIKTLWNLFENVEIPYTKVLWKNERNGVLIDREYLDRIRPIAKAEIDNLEKAINKEAGRLINSNSPAQLREYFFDKLHLEPLRATKGGKSGIHTSSVDKSFLEHYAPQVPMAKYVLEHRSLSKLYGTYIEGIGNLLDPYDRIHTRFNQDVARCMPAGELVLTNRGYLPVQNVRVGDLVITHTGEAKSVIETSRHTPTQIIQVSLKNGCMLRTTYDHEYQTIDGWCRADMLREGTSVVVHSCGEEWRKVPKWENYSVSSWGRVRNDITGNILAQYKKGKWGHLKVTLSRNGAQLRAGGDKKDIAVHSLVCKTFLRAPRIKEETRHLNGIAWDNTLGNLSYGNSRENTEDSRRHGTLNGAPKLSWADVERIKNTSSPGQPPSTSSKLTHKTAQIIKQRYSKGAKIKEMAKEYDVSYVAIHNIVRNKTWTKFHKGTSAKELADEYGVSAAAIRDIWAGRRWNREQQIPIALFTTSEVTNIVPMAKEETFGLTVADNHTHVTGGIVTHNTGRLSSADPNLQNIPKAAKDKWKLRGAFIAPKNRKLIVCDYEQLEMRLLACASLEPGMIEVINRGWDIHMGNAAMIFGYPYEEIKEAKRVEKEVKQGTLPPSALTERMHDCVRARDTVKTLGFGIIYGMGPIKMANALKISRGEAEEKIAIFKSKYPAIEKFTKEAVEETQKTGYAFTILGRRRNLPQIGSYRRDEQMEAARQAVNTPIQGSAADVVKMAQVLLDKNKLDERFDCHSELQVHDELMHECPEEAAEFLKGEIKGWMECPFTEHLAVPLAVDAGIGQSWSEAK